MLLENDVESKEGIREAISEELRKLRQWVCSVDGKIPINPRTLSNASTTNPVTWGIFEEAIDCVGKTARVNVDTSREEREVRGVGFVFTESDPYCGVDLDGCRSGRVVKRGAWGIAKGPRTPWAIAVCAFVGRQTSVNVNRVSGARVRRIRS